MKVVLVFLRHLILNERDINSEKVAAIEQYARNNIELTLDGIIDFIKNCHGDFTSDYKVFKEQFVVCWAGNEKKVENTIGFVYE